MAPCPSAEYVVESSCNPVVLTVPSLSHAGIARCTSEDDVYEGYTIPKGTIVMPNVWFVSLDISVLVLQLLTFTPRPGLSRSRRSGHTTRNTSSQNGSSRRPGRHRSTQRRPGRSASRVGEQSSAQNVAFFPSSYSNTQPPPRRICPGKALGENSVFILIATLLAMFDIAPPDDGNLKPDFGLGLVRCVCTIAPPSPCLG